MSDQNPTTPDPSDAVPGYEPPATAEPAPAEPPAYTPPAAPEPPAYTPPSAAEPPVQEPPAYTPPAAPEPPAYTPPTSGYEPPAAPEPPAYTPPSTGYEPPAAGYAVPAAGYQPPTGGYEPPAAGGYEPPAGSYPPADGGYAPPPGGGYQPPPGGGGYPPAGGGYSDPGYGQGAPRPFAVGDAISYGWNKFTKNVGPLVVVTLVSAVAAFVLYMIGIFLALAIPGGGYDPYTGQRQPSAAGFAVLMLFYVAAAAVSLIIMVGLVKAAIDITYGRPVTMQSVFKVENLGNAILTYLLVGVLTGIGAILCALPGLVVAYFAQFAIYFALDKGMRPVESLKASFAMVRANIGPTIALFLVVALIASAGSIVCGIGVLVTIPLGLIAMAYGYRVLQGEVVAP